MKKALAALLTVSLILLPFSSCAKRGDHPTVQPQNGVSSGVSTASVPVSSAPAVSSMSTVSSVPATESTAMSKMWKVTQAAGKAVSKPAPTKPASAVNLMANIHAADIQTVTPPDGFYTAETNFSLNLLKNSYQSGQSCLLSPLSVYAALGMAANGAGGNTLKQFENVLGGGLSVDDLDLNIKSYLSDLTGQKYYNTALNVADSVWIDNRFTPKIGFLQKSADYFGGNVFHTDLSNPSVAGLVDQWAASQSNGLIRNIADHLSGQEAMLLVNAMCFNARWENFSNTHNETFTPENGKSFTASFMENNDCSYLSDGNVQGALVRYMDSRFAFAVILPNPNVSLAAYTRSLDAAKWRTLIDNPVKNCVADIELPKFTTAFSTDMKAPLAQMGLCDAFNTGKADFSGIASQIYISQVQHSTYMTINETRTIAGAATLVAYPASCVIRRGDIKTISLDFNRPFLYAVVDYNTGIPLFIGTMDSPKS